MKGANSQSRNLWRRSVASGLLWPVQEEADASPTQPNAAPEPNRDPETPRKFWPACKTLAGRVITYLPTQCRERIARSRNARLFATVAVAGLLLAVGIALEFAFSTGSPSVGLMEILRLNKELFGEVEKGNVTEVKLLIRGGANVNVKDEHGWTPLHYATSHIEVAKVLIDNGANVNAENKYGTTPLHFAGSTEVAKLLLDNGADVNARDGKGQTPLHKAVSEAHPEVADLLRKHGAKE